MKNRLYFNYEKTMTNEDIVEHAKIIAQASKEVKEIEESRKKLKELQNTIARHSRYIQIGKIDFHCYGEFEWHQPIHNAVTISSPIGEFETYIRDMTPAEIEEHCEMEIPFEGTTPSDAEEEEDDRELSEIFGTDEKPESDFEWIIEHRESNKIYPWAISKKRPLGIHPEEVFRTKEEAEEFMTKFIVGNNTYHSIPGSIYQLNRNSVQWEIVKCSYKGEEIDSATVLYVYTCYYEAKETLERLYNAVIKEGKSIFPPKQLSTEQEHHSPTDQKVISDTANYKIVENPDGSLKTIRKGGEEVEA